MQTFSLVLYVLLPLRPAPSTRSPYLLRRTRYIHPHSYRKTHTGQDSGFVCGTTTTEATTTTKQFHKASSSCHLPPPLSSHHGMYLNRRQDTTHFCSSSGTLCTIYPTAEQINITISCFLVYSAGHRNRALLCSDMAQAQTVESPHWG